MRKRILLIAAVLSTLILLNCTNLSDSEAGNPGITTAGLINMPTSVAQNSKTRAKEDPVNDLYLHILEQNYFINELINGDDGASVKSLLKAMAHLPWNFIVSWGNYDTTIGTEHFAMTYTENEELPYYILIEDLTPGASWKISVKVNGDEDLIKGEVKYFIENPKEHYAESLFINLDFNKTASTRYLNLQATQNIDINSKDFQKDAGKSWDYSLMEVNGILHISAASYHPYITDFNNNDTLCYNYTTVADTNTNLAKVNLGIVPTSYNGNDSATIFGTYSMANVYGAYLVDFLKNNDSTDSYTQQLIVTSYKDSVDLLTILLDKNYTLKSASEISTMTLANLKTFLSLNENLSVDSSYSEFLWLTKIAQPVFFDENGYADNGTTYDSKFNFIAAESCKRTIKNPSVVKSLDLSSD